MAVPTMRQALRLAGFGLAAALGGTPLMAQAQQGHPAPAPQPPPRVIIIPQQVGPPPPPHERSYYPPPSSLQPPGPPSQQLPPMLPRVGN
ncbi:MAG: hypothetical protein EKK41_22435 [Hyphomicrobiales bacterium]|nr:MAG: hypothetical protein EKK41_22435 [Hyphomicrobiales bacterium]